VALLKRCAASLVVHGPVYGAKEPPRTGADDVLVSVLPSIVESTVLLFIILDYNLILAL
jgi:hypothetical protein